MPKRRNVHGGRQFYLIEGEGLTSAIVKIKSRGNRALLASAGTAPNEFAKYFETPPVEPDPERETKFCRMFPGLPPLQPSDEALIELGRAMLEADSPPEGDTEIPAGMTYLGQFIDHDITLDLTEGLPTSVLDPTAIENGRTPGLDLDSVYGAGPGEGSNSAAYEDDGLHLTLGQTTGRDIFGVDEAFPNDLPRKPADDPECPRAAIIGDGRNDENLAVAQTHLAFLKFHNRIVDEGNHSFEDARRVARQHYQSIVLHDFLPRLVDPAVADDVATNGRKFFMPDGLAAGMRPCMPVEFSVAAYRLGHSMIRNEYEWNRVFSSTGPGSIATLGLVFEFSEVSTHRGIFTEPTVPSDWIIRWNSFHDFTGIGSISNHPQFNVVRRIDTVLAQKLDDLPEFKDLPPEQDFMKSLAARNLLRGKYLGLPSGQDVARAMGATPLTASEIREGEHASIIDEHRFGDATPLWYYILKEAEVQQDGQRLGEVGSRILLETFHALVEGSQDSILREENWGPTLASVDADRFTFADLLMFVDDINPIGD